MAILAISSLGLYPIVLGGWSGNSVYSLIGGIRAIVQMISYEISLGLIIMPIVLFSGSFNLTDIVLAQKNSFYFYMLFPLPAMYFLSVLGETHRAPFDLPEAEAELVAGYNVEYSGTVFSLYFLAEYGNMVVYSIVFVYLFVGGWLPLISFIYLPPEVWLIAKASFIFAGFILIRAILPRYRFDQLLDIG